MDRMRSAFTTWRPLRRPSGETKTATPGQPARASIPLGRALGQRGTGHGLLDRLKQAFSCTAAPDSSVRTPPPRMTVTSVAPHAEPVETKGPARLEQAIPDSTQALTQIILDELPAMPFDVASLIGDYAADFRDLKDSRGAYRVPIEYEQCRPLESVPDWETSGPLAVYIAARAPKPGEPAEQPLGPALVLGQGLHHNAVFFTEKAPPLYCAANIPEHAHSGYLKWGVGHLWECKPEFMEKFSVTHYGHGPEIHGRPEMSQALLRAFKKMEEGELLTILVRQCR